jgi:hypothetical protein
MSLNRHNPFVAALSTLVEPAPSPAVEVAVVRPPEHPTFLERIESWAAYGQSFGSASDVPAGEMPDETTIEVRTHQLFPYYY